MLPLKEPLQRSDGNAEVIACLERWLKRAKEHGRIGAVAVVAAENLKHVVSDYAGSLELSFAMNWGMDTAKYQMLVRGHGRHLDPFAAPSVGEKADRICYDITKGPACYDWISWLVLAEMNRIKEGAPAPLKVGFRMIGTPEEQDLHKRERAPFYHNVIFPSLGFVGAVADEASNDAPTMAKYTMAPLVELSRAGEAVPLLRPSPGAVAAVEEYLDGGQKPVTITLRETHKHEFRNSNLTEWLKVAEHLSDHGERVILVRDTERAHDPIFGYQTCPAASLDVDVRLALYESARANLFVSNGPWMLALFGSRPWLMFVETNEMSPFFPETPQFWMQWHGIHHEQFPWSLPSQRIIWKRDNADNIIPAWEQLVSDHLFPIAAQAAE